MACTDKGILPSSMPLSSLINSVAYDIIPTGTHHHTLNPLAYKFKSKRVKSSNCLITLKLFSFQQLVKT